MSARISNGADRGVAASRGCPCRALSEIGPLIDGPDQALTAFGVQPEPQPQPADWLDYPWTLLASLPPEEVLTHLQRRVLRHFAKRRGPAELENLGLAVRTTAILDVGFPQERAATGIRGDLEGLDAGHDHDGRSARTAGLPRMASNCVSAGALILAHGAKLACT